MTKTYWYGGPNSSLVMPEDYVSTSWIEVIHECPSPTLQNGYVDTEFQKVFNTKIEYKPGTLKVFINNKIIDQFEEVTEKSFKIDAVYQGYITVSYDPGKEVDFFGGLDALSDLKQSTNVQIRYVQFSIKILNQLRYAVNRIEKEIDIPQTRWSGGVFSDEFNVAIFDEDNNIERSNLVSYATEISPQLIYEIKNAIDYIINIKNINLTPFSGDLYGPMGISYYIIEWMRRTINRIEVIV